MPRRHQHLARAFTLLELGIAIVIITLVVSVLFPAIGAFKRLAQESSGTNGVITGVIAARAYAPRDRIGIFADINGTGRPGTYSGVAILFTPANELRLVENVPHAMGPGGPLELQGLNGYADIADRDYIVMPANVGVMGITRIKSGGSSALRLLLPPFAIRFDQNGQLMPGDKQDPASYVHYDGDDDNVWDYTIHRDNARSVTPFGDVGGVGGTYDPTYWDPYTVRDQALLKKNQTTQRFPLPFDKIETVIGVLLFDKANFAGRYGGAVIPARIDIADTDNLNLPKFKDKEKWLLENGMPMFFSRYSGTMMR